MKYAKSLMTAGASTILTGTAAFEFATFSSLRYSSLGYKIPQIALLVSAFGLLVWMIGCVLVCRTAPGPTLFGGGAILLLVLFLGGSLLDHFVPAVTNIHVGMGGVLAPMAACFLSGILFVLAGIFRLSGV